MNKHHSHRAFLERFYDLSIGRKQAISLVVCQLVPIIGFGVGSTLVLMNSLRTQLLSQAKSEAAVTETNYNIKVNQMGFGSRGQSDNPAIINAARAHQQGEPLRGDLQNQVKQILQNEVKARNMEYATLVGKDLRIVVNANANRAGETISFANLANLVKQSIKDTQQIKASEIVPWDELVKEAPPLPDGFAKRDAIVRYVVTPVKNPDTQEVVGALVFGDIVNGKLPIVENTLKALNGGYSAIYLRQPKGDFALAVSLNQGDAPNQKSNQPVALPETSLLATAALAKGEAVTQRLKIGDQTYTVAAKALPNRIVENSDGASAVFSSNPAAILVRGTPENAINSLLMTSLVQEGIVLFLSLLAIIGWSLLFRRTIVKPIQQLEQTTQEFEGDRTVRAEIFSQDEVGQLAHAFNRMANSIALSETALAAEATRQAQQAKAAKALSDVTLRMHRLLNADSIWQTAVDEAYDFLKVDRALVYSFDPDSLNATIVAEAIVSGRANAIRTVIADPLGLTTVDQYSTESAWTVYDVDRGEINPHHQHHLNSLDAKAEIAAPIQSNHRTVGLLSVHQCSQPRQWQSAEINFLTQLALQIGYALDQAQLLQEKQSALQVSEALQGSLQHQIITLLTEVEGASRGDLTVRAEVTAGDIGTVSDFFNAIVENLRQIVVKVKQSAVQVNHLLGENEGAMQQLADEALKQAEETTHILDSVEQMTDSIQAVADNAHQAAEVARSASNTAEIGESAMDVTVQKITSLRQTIEDAAKKVKQLDEASQQISRAVSLISEIAVQTDLLAINASLEASRAGEQGRGFAVVASEVAELAARSTAATHEIEQIVAAIQHETRVVVDVMKQGAVQVVEGAHSVRNAKQSLIQIVYVSHKIDTLVQSISQATVSQAQTSRSVTSLIKDIAQVSTRTSDSSRRVSEALHQTVDVAQELQNSVEMFKVDAESGTSNGSLKGDIS